MFSAVITHAPPSCVPSLTENGEAQAQLHRHAQFMLRLMPFAPALSVLPFRRRLSLYQLRLHHPLCQLKLSSTATRSSCCDSCHLLPPSLYCRSDAAYLCINCDSTIHSANSLARRHHRVPLLPIPPGGLIVGGISVAQPKEDDEDEKEEEEEKDGFFLEGEVDEYFDLVEFSTSCEEEGKERYEGREEEDKRMLQSFQMGYEGLNKGIDYTASIRHAFFSQESLSSIEARVVAEDSMMSISSSQIRTSIQIPQQFSSMDREARVLRYREKRKTRKFQKVIRYASRKAYAETRPRIKGRFVKKTDAELEVDQMFAAPHVMVEAGYGVVHSY